MVKSLAIIGVGAFGEFSLKHLTPYFETKIHDNSRDLSSITSIYNVTPCDLREAAECDIVILAVPVMALEDVSQKISGFLKKGQLVMDVASVKSRPQEILSRILPETVDIVGLHPLFGPESGKDGIRGLNISVVNVRGSRAEEVGSFLKEELGLNVMYCTAAEHDQQMAYVQGITHMIARVIAMMDVPELKQTTRTFELLLQMVDTVKNDSPELFRAIQTQNPFVEKTKRDFFESVKKLEAEIGGLR